MRLPAALFIITTSLVAAIWASAPSAKNGVVITTNPDFVEGCEYAGEVRAGSSWGGLTMKGVAEKKTYKKLSKRAAEAGMDIVLVHSSKVGFGGSRAQATGYICEPILACSSTDVFQRHEYPTESTKGVENIPPGFELRVYAHGPKGWVITNIGWVRVDEASQACGGVKIEIE